MDAHLTCTGGSQENISPAVGNILRQIVVLSSCQLQCLSSKLRPCNCRFTGRTIGIGRTGSELQVAVIHAVIISRLFVIVQGTAFNSDAVALVCCLEIRKIAFRVIQCACENAVAAEHDGCAHGQPFNRNPYAGSQFQTRTADHRRTGKGHRTGIKRINASVDLSSGNVKGGSCEVHIRTCRSCATFDSTTGHIEGAAVADHITTTGGRNTAGDLTAGHVHNGLFSNIQDTAHSTVSRSILFLGQLAAQQIQPTAVANHDTASGGSIAILGRTNDLTAALGIHDRQLIINQEDP